MESGAHTDAGWYQNPDGSGGFRYWDGAAWTGLVRPPSTRQRAPRRRGRRWLVPVVCLAMLLGAGLVMFATRSRPPAQQTLSPTTTGPSAPLPTLVPMNPLALVDPRTTMTVLVKPPPGGSGPIPTSAPRGAQRSGPDAATNGGPASSEASGTPDQAATTVASASSTRFAAPVVAAARVVSCVPHPDNAGADLVVGVDFKGGNGWDYGGNGIGGDEYRFVLLSQDATMVHWTIDFAPVRDLADDSIVHVPLPAALVLAAECGEANGRPVSVEW